MTSNLPPEVYLIYTISYLFMIFQIILTCFINTTTSHIIMTADSEDVRKRRKDEGNPSEKETEAQQKPCKPKGQYVQIPKPHSRCSDTLIVLSAI